MPICHTPHGRSVSAKNRLVLFPMLILNIDLVNLTGNMCTCIYIGI